MRVRKPDEAPGEGDALDDADEPAGNFLFKLPAPPSPYKDRLGDPEEFSDVRGFGAGRGADSEPPEELCGPLGCVGSRGLLPR